MHGEADGPPPVPRPSPDPAPGLRRCKRQSGAEDGGLQMDARSIVTQSGDPEVSSETKADQGLSQRLASLHRLSLSELRAEWRRLFRSAPPSLSRDLILRAVAYRVQELAHGGLPKVTLRKLATLAGAFQATGEVRADPGPQVKPGGRLVREWHGRTHTVTATESGFEYE